MTRRPRPLLGLLSACALAALALAHVRAFAKLVVVPLGRLYWGIG